MKSTRSILLAHVKYVIILVVPISIIYLYIYYPTFWKNLLPESYSVFLKSYFVESSTLVVFSPSFFLYKIFLYSLFVGIFLFFPAFKVFYWKSIDKMYSFFFGLNAFISYYAFSYGSYSYFRGDIFFKPIFIFDVPFHFTVFSAFVFFWGSVFFTAITFMPLKKTKKTYFNIWLMYMIFILLFFLTTVRNFYVLFFFMELLSFFVVILLMNSSDYLNHVWAVIQYFVFTCITTILFTFFLLKLSTYVADLSYLSVFSYVSNNSDYASYYLVGILFVFLFKLGFAPMHHILIDVYSNLSFIIFTFLVYFYKTVLFCLLILIYYNIYFESGESFLVFISCCSIFFGAFGVVSSISLRRILLFSSLFTSGICLLLVVLNFWYFSFFYFLIYSFFSFLISMLFSTYEQLYNKLFFYIEDLKRFNNPFILYPLNFCFIVLMGLPPFPIFWFKATLYSVVLTKYGFFFVILLIFLSTVATYGYLKIIYFFLYSSYSKFSYLPKDISPTTVSFTQLYSKLRREVLILYIGLLFFIGTIFYYFIKVGVPVVDLFLL